MSQETRIYVAGIGTVTSLGATPSMLFATVNAGISGIAETAFLNKRFHPIKMATVPDEILPAIDPALIKKPFESRQFRLLQLAARALSLLTPQLPDDQHLPLFLSLPEFIPGYSNQIAGNFIEQLVLQSGVKLDAQNSKVAAIGRAGGIYAVDVAHRYFESSGNDYVIVGGVDTYWDPHLLARLDADDRLNVINSVDGFLPGEGATFLLLASDRVKDQLPSPRLSLSKPGIAKEPGHRYSDQPYKGEGLSSAVTQAIANGPALPIDSVWTSMIYDHYCHKEFGVALTRNSAHLAPNIKMVHPVDCLGDLGAAMGPTLIALAAMSGLKQPKIKEHLICSSSELDYRTALRCSLE